MEESSRRMNNHTDLIYAVDKSVVEITMYILFETDYENPIYYFPVRGSVFVCGSESKFWDSSGWKSTSRYDTGIPKESLNIGRTSPKLLSLYNSLNGV